MGSSSVSAQRLSGGAITRRCMIAVTRTATTPSSGLLHEDGLARRAVGLVRREEVLADRVVVLSAARSRISCRGGAPRGADGKWTPHMPRLWRSKVGLQFYPGGAETTDDELPEHENVSIPAFTISCAASAAAIRCTAKV